MKNHTKIYDAVMSLAYHFNGLSNDFKSQFLTTGLQYTSLFNATTFKMSNEMFHNLRFYTKAFKRDKMKLSFYDSMISKCY